MATFARMAVFARMESFATNLPRIYRQSIHRLIGPHRIGLRRFNGRIIRNGGTTYYRIAYYNIIPYYVKHTPFGVITRPTSILYRRMNGQGNIGRRGTSRRKNHSDDYSEQKYQDNKATVIKKRQPNGSPLRIENIYRLFNCRGYLRSKFCHFFWRHLNMMGEVEIARFVEWHEMDMGVGNIYTDNGCTYFNTGTNFLKALCHLAGKKVKIDIKIIFEVKDIIHFLLGNAKHMTANNRIHVEKREEIVGFGNLVTGNLTCDYTGKD